MKVSCIMTVRDEPADRLRRRLTELDQAAEAGVVDELLVAVPLTQRSALERLGGELVHLELRVVDNPTGDRSAGLNRATLEARAAIVVRVDARSSVTAKHIRAMTAVLDSDGSVGITGGRQAPVAGGPTLRARGIARALANPVALGNARYRRRRSAGVADTVYLGACRREELVAIGGWDESLAANEDFDLCQRFAHAGKLVWLVPLDVTYEARDSVRALWRQYVAFGRAKRAYWRLRAQPPQGRQVLALCAAAAGFCFAPAILSSRRRVVAATLTAAVALVVLDSSNSESAPVPVRITASSLYPVIWAGWLAGIARG